MSRFSLLFLALCAIAIYSVVAEKRKMNCGKKPPKGADFHPRAQGQKCEGTETINGKLCCCKCGENTKKNGGRGYYCNNDKFKYCTEGKCRKPPPADADFRKCTDDQECKGQLRIDGKKCCAQCSEAVGEPGRGYYCNPKYCPMQNGSTTETTSSSESTTASSSDSTTSATTAAAGSTTSAAGSTTSAAGSTTSAAGSTTSAAGSTTSAAGSTTSAAGSTTSAAGSTTSAAGSTTSAAGSTTSAGGSTTAAPAG